MPVQRTAPAPPCSGGESREGCHALRRRNGSRHTSAVSVTTTIVLPLIAATTIKTISGAAIPATNGRITRRP